MEIELKIPYCEFCKYRKAIRTYNGKYICKPCAVRSEIGKRMQRPPAYNKKHIPMHINPDRFYSKKYGMPKKE